MRRHPQNHNLHIHHDHTYQGLPVMHEKGPFIREHLQRLYDTMQRALDEHPRTFAFRVELKFPSSGMLPSYAFRNEVISRFFESFKAKIEHNRSMARCSGQAIPDNGLSFFSATAGGSPSLA
ncbi:inovirus-type Gp2 protein, partial [Pseudomonas sp. NW5]|uniref:YagK/YfjJ domain-containing protein n=1 Tax=Pseudomonas sp. NW5 TaxID=2934934 RepID=UPI002021A563